MLARDRHLQSLMDLAGRSGGRSRPELVGHALRCALQLLDAAGAVVVLVQARQGEGFSLLDASVVYELPGHHWTVGLHGKNLTNKKYVTAGYNFMNVNPYTGDYISNGATPGAAFGVPGFEAALGREGVLTAYYGNPRQIFMTVGYKL